MEQTKICWVCRSEPANTGEHKWPSSYLRRHFPKNWRELYHGRGDGHKFNTQGPDSRNLKNTVLCARCNNQRTAPQDKALNSFLLYLENNRDQILEQRKVCLSEALGAHRLADFYRALLKLEFSRLRDDEVAISPEIADFVSGADNWKAANERVRIEFRVSEGVVPEGLGVLLDTEAPFYENPYFVSHQINFGWFGIHYLHAPYERPDLPWPAWEEARISLMSSGFEERQGLIFPII